MRRGKEREKESGREKERRKIGAGRHKKLTNRMLHKKEVLQSFKPITKNRKVNRGQE